MRDLSRHFATAEHISESESESGTESSWSSSSMSSGRCGHVGVVLAACAKGLYNLVVFVVLAIRLTVYSLLLCPWFLSVGWGYFWSRRIRRGVRYGPNPRNFLDIYFPTEAMASEDAGAHEKVPVVIAIMGGAWLIGYRVWSVLLGLRLSQVGVIVVAVDYRNFPATDMDGMIEDVSRGIDWTFANIARYHGDPEQVLLVGQSAGAHLSVMAMLERSLGLQKAQQPGQYHHQQQRQPSGESWEPRNLKGFFGVSGPYDLVGLESHIASRGVYNPLPHMCGGNETSRYSPTRLLALSEWQAAAPGLPPVHLFYGELDNSVPRQSAIGFASALRSAGAPCVVEELGLGVRHAEPVLEDPLTGGDMQIKLMLPCLPKDVAQRLRDTKPPYWQVPHVLAGVAKRLMPF